MSILSDGKQHGDRQCFRQKLLRALCDISIGKDPSRNKTIKQNDLEKAKRVWLSFRKAAPLKENQIPLGKQKVPDYLSERLFSLPVAGTACILHTFHVPIAGSEAFSCSESTKNHATHTTPG